MEDRGPMMDMGPMDKMGDMMGMCLDNAEKIGLTEGQISKLTPLHREMKKKQVRYKADIKLAEMDLMEIMEVKDFDLEKATAATKKIADIKSAYHTDMLKLMKEVRSTLTEEQFKKLQKMKHSKIDMNMKNMKMDGMKPDKKRWIRSNNSKGSNIFTSTYIAY
jgi:Spy/CpxP family protein refolding chaperone